jgi:hypothetical protein
MCCYPLGTECTRNSLCHNTYADNSSEYFVTLLTIEIHFEFDKDWLLICIMQTQLIYIFHLE